MGATASAVRPRSSGENFGLGEAGRNRPAVRRPAKLQAWLVIITLMVVVVIGRHIAVTHHQHESDQVVFLFFSQPQVAEFIRIDVFGHFWIWPAVILQRDFLGGIKDKQIFARRFYITCVVEVHHGLQTLEEAIVHVGFDDAIVVVLALASATVSVMTVFAIIAVIRGFTRTEPDITQRRYLLLAQIRIRIVNVTLNVFEESSQARIPA